MVFQNLTKKQREKVVSKLDNLIRDYINQGDLFIVNTDRVTNYDISRDQIPAIDEDTFEDEVENSEGTDFGSVIMKMAKYRIRDNVGNLVTTGSSDIDEGLLNLLNSFSRDMFNDLGEIDEVNEYFYEVEPEWKQVLNFTILEIIYYIFTQCVEISKE